MAGKDKPSGRGKKPQKPKKKARTRSKPRQANRNGRPPLGTEDWKPHFLAALTNGFHVKDAAEHAKICLTTAYRERESNKEFCKAWNKACRVGGQELKREAARRAYHGCLKPIYQQGVRVGQVREYSDSLMQFLLKAKFPHEFRDNTKIEFEDVTPGRAKRLLLDTLRKRREQRALANQPQPETPTPPPAPEPSTNGNHV